MQWWAIGPFSINDNDYFQDRKCDIQMCQFCFVFSYHADVLFMLVESLFHPFTSKYQTAKCICPNCQMYIFLQNCKMYLSCWCIIYVCWEPFSSIQIKIFEEKTLANWIILQRRIKVKLLIEFSKYNTIVQIWCQTQSKWLATSKYNIFEE